MSDLKHELRDLLVIFEPFCCVAVTGLFVAWHFLKRDQVAERADARKPSERELALELERAERVIHALRERLAAGPRS